MLDHATRLGITRERYLVLDHREGFAGALAEIFRIDTSPLLQVVWRVLAGDLVVWLLLLLQGIETWMLWFMKKIKPSMHVLRATH